MTKYKATAIAPSNIAFIKYWGKKNQELKLPENASISMTLDDNISTKTTVEFLEDLENDILEINEENQGGKKLAKVSKFLDIIRKMAGINLKAKVISENTFPAGTGLSSSASGFAALALAGSKAAGLDLKEKELSILARLGSGSASRSIPSGFVKWLDGDTSETSYSKTIFEKSHWDLTDVVAVVSSEIKQISSTDGQKSTGTSPFYDLRLKNLNQKIEKIEKAIAEKNFTEFGKILEADALELHSIMLTSQPSLIYLSPGSIKIMNQVKEWRKKGLEVYFSLNTGENIHLICKQEDAQKIQTELKKLNFVRRVIASKIGDGARIINS